MQPYSDQNTPARSVEDASDNQDLMRFGFGRNWADYLDSSLTPERVKISQQHLLAFLKLDSLRNLSFLDIGCGSGVHSLAAWQTGARSVFSFDYDPESVAATKRLHALAGHPKNWTVREGSILDREFVNSIPKADVVYSWGVLHHTGSMWEALANAASTCAGAGVLYTALYSSDVYVDPPPEYWIEVKRAYNRAGRLGKLAMEAGYVWRHLVHQQLMRGINPIRHVLQYKRSRGMSYIHDVRDWLGGYPMEFAGNVETAEFAQQELGMELIHQRAGQGNTEFLFRRIGASNYWDEVIAEPACKISGPFEQLGGHAWKARVDGNGFDPERFMLYESTRPVGWPVGSTSAVSRLGAGRYHLENSCLIFSCTDNGDPNASGRFYTYRSNFL